MKKSLVVVLCLGLLASCGGGGNDAAPPPPPPPPPPTAVEQLAIDLQGLSLDDFYFESFKALTLRTPEVIIWRAIGSIFPTDQVLLDNYNDDYRRDTFAMHQVVLDALLTYDRSSLSQEEQLHYDVYQWHLQDTVDRLEFIYYDFIATYSLFGIQRETEQFFTGIHPLETRQDAEDYITRLGRVAAKFGQIADHLTRQSGAGVIEPALTLDTAIFYMAEFADGAADSNPYYTRFAADIAGIAELTDADRTELRDRALASTAGSVIPGYQQLRQTMQSLLSNASPSIGVGQFPRGADYYTYILRHHTTTDLTAAEIHQLGLDELVRIHAEMRLIFDQLGYPQNESLLELFTRVRTDGGVIPAANVKSTFEGLIAAAEQNLDQAFEIFPAANVVVAEDDFGGYYIGPSFDGTRPGAFYAGTERDQPWFQMPSLTYHESLPGHHTQIALAMEADAPAFRKLVRFTAFVEGWALYAERLAYELNWYDNDVYGNLGRLQFEALRAARLVMDTGIHSLGWSFNQATQFNMDNVGASIAASQGAAGRYSVIPGQATAYMVGMLQILAVRRRAMDELGAQFDLKKFHTAVLSGGAVPLSLLDSVVDRYIEETRSAMGM